MKIWRILKSCVLCKNEDPLYVFVVTEVARKVEDTKMVQALEESVGEEMKRKEKKRKEKSGSKDKSDKKKQNKQKSLKVMI